MGYNPSGITGGGGGTGGGSLNTLADVDANLAYTDGLVLKADGTKFTSQYLSLNTLADVDANLTYTDGLVMRGNGSKYTGQQLSHTDLSNKGTNTHAQLDSHAASTSNPHSVTAAQAGAVGLTGNETVAGVKTFSSIPVLPASDPTTANQAVRKSYVDSALGTVAGGMTYKDVLDASGAAYPSNPTAGDYYIISVGGTISGTTYAVSDWAVYNGTGWAKIDNTQLSVTASLGVQKVGNDVRANLATSEGLKLSTNSMAVDYDNSSLGIVSTKLAVKAGGVTNAMLAGSIADSKLSAISTAGKVSGAALTSLANIPSGAGVIPVANLATGTPDGSKFVRDDGTLAIPSSGLSGINAAIMDAVVLAVPMSSQIWTNQPAAVTEIFGNTYSRLKLDLTHATYYRISVNQIVAGATGADINLQYSLDNSTYVAADAGAAGELDIGAGVGVKTGAWTALANGAKGDVWLRLVGKQGDAVADPAFRQIRVQFKMLSITTPLLALTSPDLSVWDITIDNNGNLTRTKR